jgi:hypothetical protein
MIPENSTPIVLGACGGNGYLPSRCMMSMRFKPKAFTLTTASDLPGTGFGVSELMKRADAGPLPPSISRYYRFVISTILQFLDPSRSLENEVEVESCKMT